MPKLYLELIEDKGEDGKKSGIMVVWQRCIIIIIIIIIIDNTTNNSDD